MAGRIDLHVSRINQVDAKTSLREQAVAFLNSFKVQRLAPALV
jgi:hypothetical protein